MMPIANSSKRTIGVGSGASPMNCLKVLATKSHSSLKTLTNSTTCKSNYHSMLLSSKRRNQQNQNSRRPAYEHKYEFNTATNFGRFHLLKHQSQTLRNMMQVSNVSGSGATLSGRTPGKTTGCEKNNVQ